MEIKTIVNYIVYSLLLGSIVSCKVSKPLLSDNTFQELAGLLSNPVGEEKANLIYSDFNSQETPMPKADIEVSLLDYQYEKIDSILELLSLNFDAWDVNQLRKVYTPFANAYFKRNENVLPKLKWLNDESVEWRTALNEEVKLIRNIDYLLFAKGRYAGLGKKQTLAIFKEECADRKKFSKMLIDPDLSSTASEHLKAINYFNSDQYLYHVEQFNIPLWAGRYTALDRFVYDLSSEMLSSLLAFVSDLKQNPDLLNEESLAFQPEFRSRFYNEWLHYMDESLDSYLIEKIQLDTVNIYSSYSGYILRRGNPKAVNQLFNTLAYSTSFERMDGFKVMDYNHLLLQDDYVKSNAQLRTLVAKHLSNLCDYPPAIRSNLLKIAALDWQDVSISELLESARQLPCD